MLKDCIEFSKGCQGCQKHGGIQRVPASELHSIVKPWPFRGWALDVIGEIKPKSSKGHKYILVGIDYFTKWIEAIPLKEVTQEDVINFIQNYIIYRFGIPETITTDQGSVFTGRKMVEAANKNIIFIIKWKTERKRKNWHEVLGEALWACRMSPKESTNTTPFRLAFGHDVVLPVEILLQSTRIQRQFEIPTNHYWNMILDELVDLDEERLMTLEVLTKQKERVTKAYNKKSEIKVIRSRELGVESYFANGQEESSLGKMVS
ncbi:protein NYNRIN-like [Medicago truncatula]|uniref:protein NYNRIN-like n=1 Tax=Medicago truncatula TaxID=3880 RepID=UPI000D2F47C9|nr:protein NYNRIN-like [Medicago truncatula]